MSDPQKTAERTVAHMLSEDAFSRWLGVEVIDLRPDHCTLRMTVRPEMCNGFGICHGGISFSLADSAFAFAANSHNRLSVSIENNIAYTEKARAGDALTATCEPRALGHKLATYDVNVTNQAGTVIALFRGNVYRTSRSVTGEEV